MIRKYFILELKKYLFYKSDIFVNIALKIISCSANILVYLYIYFERSRIGGYTISQIVVYTIFMYSIFDVLNTEVGLLIRRLYRDGTIITLMVRPFGLIRHLAYSTACKKVLTVLFVTVPLFIIMSILFGFDLLHPLPAYNAVVAVLFTLAAFWIDFFMQLIFGSIIFEKMESYNILRVLQTSIRVLSGSIIPLTFYPGIVRAVLKYLPFQFLGYIPGAILAGTVTGGEYQTLFLSALLWLFVLGGASFFFYRHFIRRIAVMGG